MSTVLRLFVTLLALCGTACGSAQRAAPVVGPFKPADATQARGERTFFRFCHQCHPGGDGGLGPSINEKPLPDFAIRTQVRAGAGAMPSFSDHEISDTELDDLLAYMDAMSEKGT